MSGRIYKHSKRRDGKSGLAIVSLSLWITLLASLLLFWVLFVIFVTTTDDKCLDDVWFGSEGIPAMLVWTWVFVLISISAAAILIINSIQDRKALSMRNALPAAMLITTLVTCVVLWEFHKHATSPYVDYLLSASQCLEERYGNEID